MVTKTDVKESFEAFLNETGRSLQTSSEDVAAYIVERTAVLSNAIGEPGYEEAVVAERKALLHKLEIEGIDEADATDARLVGFLHAALSLGGRSQGGIPG